MVVEEALTSEGGGVRCKPPKLLNALTVSKVDDGLEDDDEFGIADEDADGAARRRLQKGSAELSDAARREAAMSETERLELLDISLRANGRTLEKGWDGYGGVRLPPPKLRPPESALEFAVVGDDDGGDNLLRGDDGRESGSSRDALEEDIFGPTALIEAAVLAEGGGARVKPPKLLPMGGEITVADVQAEIEWRAVMGAPEMSAEELAAFARQGLDDAAAATHTHEADDGGWTGLAGGADVEELEPLESFDGGGGVRLVPPPLKPVQTKPSGALLTDEDEFRAEFGASPLAAAEVAAGESGEAPFDTPTAELEDGFEGGGGVRVLPPPLRPVGKQTSACAADEAAFAAEFGAAPTPMTNEAGGIDAAVAPRPAAPEALEEAEVAAAGGGVRLPPPKLLPVASGSTKTAEDRQEESSYHVELGPPPPDLLLPAFLDASATAKHLLQQEQAAEPVAEALQEAEVAAAGGGVRLPPPRLLPVASGGLKTAEERQEETAFQEALGAPPPDLLVPAVLAATATMQHLLQPEVVVEKAPLEKMEAFGLINPRLLEETDGGVRVMPPKLLPVGATTKKDAQAATEYAMEMGAIAAQAEDPRAKECAERIAKMVPKVTYPAGNIELTERQLIAIQDGRMTYLEAEMEVRLPPSASSSQPCHPPRASPLQLRHLACPHIGAARPAQTAHDGAHQAEDCEESYREAGRARSVRQLCESHRGRHQRFGARGGQRGH